MTVLVSALSFRPGEFSFSTRGQTSASLADSYSGQSSWYAAILNTLVQLNEDKGSMLI